MAKEKAEKKKASKKEVKKAKRKAPPPVEKPEFGVDALAKEMGVEVATVRVKLRNAGIEKGGRTYDFKSASGVKQMAKKLAA